MHHELEQALLGDSAHTPPANILEALPEALAHQQIPGAPHTIYQELWHICFWLRISLDWIDHRPTPFPTDPGAAFAANTNETLSQLTQRFFTDIQQAAALTHNPTRLAEIIACPSPPPKPTRHMSVEDQLISLAAHNSYHFGRIVLLRQLLHAWPPPSGGFTW